MVVRRLGNLAYVIARVKSRKRYLLKKEDYEKMLGMDLSAIARFMGESQYAREIHELGLRFSGAELVERALYANLARSYSDVLRFCKYDLRRNMENYMKRWDVYNIKTAMRGHSYGEDPERLKNSFIPAGTLKKECLQELAVAGDIETMISSLKKTEYYDILMDEMKKGKLEGRLSRLENVLDKHYYHSLIRNIKVRTRGDVVYLSFLRKEIDIINLKNLLLLKREGVDPQVIKEYILEGGEEVIGERLSTFLSAKGFDDAISTLGELSCFNEVKPVLSSAKETLIPVERALEKFIATKAKSFSYMEPLSILPIMDYVLHKKIEVDNIRIILRGKEKGLPEEKIKGMLLR